MLNVSYLNQYGTCEIRNDNRTYKIHICKANATCAFIYFYKTAEGKKLAKLEGFIGDKEHLKRMLENNKFTFNNFRLRGKEMNEEMWTIVRILSVRRYKITINC